MDGYLKLSTAATIWVGPYHSTDGLTSKSNLKISAGVFQIAKNGGAYANKTHTSVVTTLTAPGGWYGTKLSVADTNTPGILYYKSRVSSYPPVWGNFAVLPKAVYSAMFGTGYLPVNAVQVASATPETKADIAASVKSAGVNYAASTGLVKKISANVISNAVLANNALSAGRIATGTFTNVKFAAGAISGGTLAATAKTSIGTAVWITTARTITGLPANGISAPVFATGAITNAKFAAGALSAGIFKSTGIPAQGAPPAATNLPTQMSYVYKFMRNKTVVDSTAGTVTVYADNESTADHKATIADTGGAFTRGEFGTGA